MFSHRVWWFLIYSVRRAQLLQTTQTLDWHEREKVKAAAWRVLSIMIWLHVYLFRYVYGQSPPITGWSHFFKCIEFHFFKIEYMSEFATRFASSCFSRFWNKTDHIMTFDLKYVHGYKRQDAPYNWEYTISFDDQALVTEWGGTLTYTMRRRTYNKIPYQ